MMSESILNPRGSTAVVTGGSAGMGLAVVRHFLDLGVRVIATGRSESNLQAARAEFGEDCTLVNSDAGSLSDIAALADLVREKFGSLDVLVLNAGIGEPVPLLALTPEIYDDIFRVNARGPFFTVQQLAPLMSPGGSVVLTTSIANGRRADAMNAYAASKAALRSMVRTLAADLLDQKIRVNAVSPGAIATTMISRSSIPEEVKQQAEAHMRDNVPMKRIGTVEEIARAVAFLAFEATFTTGAEIPVDGGQSQL